MIQSGQVAGFTIKIAGRAAAEDFMADVTRITVDTNMYLPDMFTLEIFDQKLKWVDSELLAIGVEVEILAKAQENVNTPRLKDVRLVKGEITALEPEFAETGKTTLVVRGYDRSHRLHRGKKSRSFLKSSDGEIARKIAKELGLQAEVDATPTVHEYVFQNNQTDLEFLMERAQSIGFQVYVLDRTLHFQRGGHDQGETPELEWKSNLRNFNPRLSVAQQVNEVIVRGWDPATKKEIVGRALNGNAAPQLGLGKTGGALAQEAFQKQAQTVIVDRPVDNLDEANALAQAIMDEISGEFVQAEGLCSGDPRVRAGKTAKISGLGQRFSGTYLITAALHLLTDGSYQTSFTISGRQPNTLSSLLTRQNGNGHHPEGFTGVVSGIVTNTRDPENLGRVKVKFPWLAENEQSAWIRVAQGGGGQLLPEINQEVLIAFEHGDIHRPYVLGTLWNGKDKPSGATVGRDGKVQQRIIRSRTGHVIILDDSDDKAGILIRDRTGQNLIAIETSENDMVIKSKGNLTIEAGGKINIKSNSDFTVESKGRGEIKSNALTINGTQKVDVKGGQINLN